MINKTNKAQTTEKPQGYFFYLDRSQTTNEAIYRFMISYWNNQLTAPGNRFEVRRYDHYYYLKTEDFFYPHTYSDKLAIQFAIRGLSEIKISNVYLANCYLGENVYISELVEKYKNTRYLDRIYYQELCDKYGFEYLPEIFN